LVVKEWRGRTDGRDSRRGPKNLVKILIATTANNQTYEEELL